MHSPYQLRPDGFVWITDFDDDPNSPEWVDAANKSIKYISWVLGMELNDFKIECQSCDLQEGMSSNYIGYYEILINVTAFNKRKKDFLTSNSKTLEEKLEAIGFLIDGFLHGHVVAKKHND